MITDTDTGRRKLFGVQLTPAEHALVHAAAKVEGKTASAAVRPILLGWARGVFRGTLRVSEGEASPREPERAEGVPA